MKLPRRRFLQLTACAAAVPALTRIAGAQTYPTRPVRLIVGYSAGSNLDILARLMGQWLSERLGQPFVIENRPGAGSNVATEAVVRAASDGYTLLMVSAGNAINATLYDKLGFNFSRDIAPVAGIIRSTNVMVVSPSFPAKSVNEFIAYARANPGKNSALADPRIKARLADFGGTILVLSPAEFGKLIAEETEKWRKVVRAANIKAE